jgi:hypothetical protein
MGFFSLGPAGQLGLIRSLREGLRPSREEDAEIADIKSQAERAKKAAANFRSKQDNLKRNRETLLKVIGQDETLSKRFSGIDPKAMDNFLRAAQNTYQSTLSPENALRLFSGYTPDQVKSFISDETPEEPTTTVEPEERSTGEKIARGIAAFLSPSARIEQARETSEVKPEGVTDEQRQQIQAGETPSIYDQPERPVVMPDLMSKPERDAVSGLISTVSRDQKFIDKNKSGIQLTESADKAKQILLREAARGNNALFKNIIYADDSTERMRQIFKKLDKLFQEGDLSKEELNQIYASGELAIDRLLEDKAGTPATPPTATTSPATTTPSQDDLRKLYNSGKMYQGKKIIRDRDPANPGALYKYKLQD